MTVTIQSVQTLASELRSRGYTVGVAMRGPVDIIDDNTPNQYVVEARAHKAMSDQDVFAHFEQHRDTTVHLYQIVPDTDTVYVRFGVKPH
jgi:hypothetical protein